MKGEIVYVHRVPETGVIFYVGKGGNRGRAYDEYSRSKEWKDRVNNHYFDVDIIATGLTTNEAFELEELTIKTLGINTLTNKTLGGRGALGYKHTDKTKDAISKSMKAIPADIINARNKKSAKSRVENQNNKVRHIETGKVFPCLHQGCLFFNIKPKGEYQRLKRKSSNVNFERINNN